MKYNLPTVGSTVQVTTRHQNSFIFTYQSQPFIERTRVGVVVKNDRGMPADCFSVNTGDAIYPISVISVKNVIDLKILTGEKTSLRKFKVKGKNGAYMVILSGEQYSCDCIGFKYHHKCKHIDAVKNSMKSKT